MVDVPPTFDESMGTGTAQGSQDGATGEGATDGNGADGSAGDANKVADGTGDNPGPGTRAEGGLDTGEVMGDGGFGTMTAAEQVAILDGQLEASTSDFDALILEEQQKQRARERERAQSAAQSSSSTSTGPVGGVRNPYEERVMSGGNSTGGGMGGIARAGSAPENPAIYAPPGDIPEGDDDDVVARQLREAAMREPNPEIREKLWNEYRKYKGLDIPEAE